MVIIFNLYFFSIKLIELSYYIKKIDKMITVKSIYIYIIEIV